MAKRKVYPSRHAATAEDRMPGSEGLTNLPDYLVMHADTQAEVDAYLAFKLAARELVFRTNAVKAAVAERAAKATAVIYCLDEQEKAAVVAYRDAAKYAEHQEELLRVASTAIRDTLHALTTIIAPVA